MPHRGPVLAVCLLALAAGASAACIAGNFKMDLTDASGYTSDPIVKCLSSVRVAVDAACAITLTPLAASDNYVTTIWGTAAYTQLKECPTTPTNGPAAAADDTAAAVATAAAAAMNVHIYGSAVAGATVTAATFAAGVVTVKRDGNTIGLYAVSESTLAALTPKTCADNSGSDCKADPAEPCAAGAYGILTAAGKKICSLCPAGTYSAGGVGCTGCPAGKASNIVGADADTDCGNCAAGSYAQGGNSDCLLCPAGTYQDAAAQGSCKVCADQTWANFPGMTACLKCVNGVPNAVGTPSPGYHVLSITTPGNLGATCNAAYKPDLTQRCAMTEAVTLLSVKVDSDCSVVISPIADPACAEPGSGTYNYEDQKIYGYYVDATHIRTMLPTDGSGISSSFLLSLTFKAGGTLDMKYSGATTNPAEATISANECAGVVTVTGGKLADSTEVTACPAGSYSVTNQYCPPCPVGSYCASGAANTCAEDKFNPLLGKDLVGACQTCDAGASPRYTSNAGSAYCTVPWVDTTCGDGTEYDDSSATCVPCADGWKRLASQENSCVACAAGTYKSSATACSACVGNTVAPADGMNACVPCPAGSVADNDKKVCNACPPGQYEAAGTCTACAAGTYRAGDATPENNECKNIPAGFREKTVAEGAAVARSEILPCAVGTYSAWDAAGTTRTPDVSGDPENAKLCQACDLNTYAPRTGMQKCLACKAGTYPDNSGGKDGPDMCTVCEAGKFRAAFTQSATCAACSAGSEVGSSNHAACVQCRPGYYSTAAVDSCTACEQHKYQPASGQTSCINCPVGYETTNTANTECTPCSAGYYKNVEGIACIAAPAGTYVNTTAATTYSPCQYGTFSAEVGSDSCDSCPPGQYANTLGSKSCKTCPIGTYSAGRAFSCKACKPGYYASAGSAVCSACKPGTFASAERSSTCTVCPAGKFCPLSATVSPTACGKGYYSAEGAKICTPCPVNTYQSATGSTGCTKCAAGFNTRGLTGQSVCQKVRRALRLSML